MSETVRKRVVVTFDDGLPLGTHGAFTFEGRRWIAVPLEKYTAIVTVTDRLLGIVSHARTRLTQWVCAHPENAAQIVGVLTILATADELVGEKQKAQTS